MRSHTTLNTKYVESECWILVDSQPFYDITNQNTAENKFNVIISFHVINYDYISELPVTTADSYHHHLRDTFEHSI